MTMTAWSHLLTQNDDADDADDDGADNVYHAGDIRPEFENKYLPIMSLLMKNLLLRW